MKAIVLKKISLIQCKILGLFVNTFAANENYSVLRCEKSTKPIAMKFSKKQKKFSDLFYPFLKSRLNFKILENIWTS